MDVIYDPGPLVEGSDAERDRIRDLYPFIDTEAEEEEEEDEEEDESDDEDEDEEEEEEEEDDEEEDEEEEEEHGNEFYVTEQQPDQNVSGVDLRSAESSAFELELQLILSGDHKPVLPASNQVILHTL